jgi:hypothetical protein
MAALAGHHPPPHHGGNGSGGGGGGVGHGNHHSHHAAAAHGHHLQAQHPSGHGGGGALAPQPPAPPHGSVLATDPLGRAVVNYDPSSEAYAQRAYEISAQIAAERDARAASGIKRARVYWSFTEDWAILDGMRVFAREWGARGSGGGRDRCAPVQMRR